MRRLDELLGRVVSLRALHVLRVLTGPIVVLHLWPFLDDARDGRIYRDTFSEPYAAWYPHLPRDVYVALLWLCVVTALAMSLAPRRVARVATIATFAFVTYNLLLSTTHYQHNRAFLVIVLGALAVTPTADDGPAWPLWLLRVEAVVVYATSGVSKLFDADWWGGTVTWGRAVGVEHLLVSDTSLPDWAIDVVTNRDVHTVAAKAIVLIEVVVAVAFWFRRSRYAAVWLAGIFHVLIEIAASVQVFSYLAIAALVIWAVPSTGDRVVRIERTRWARIIERLDWLHRFRVERADRFEVVDRDGTVLRGRAGAALLCSRVPLTAWFALPFTALRRPVGPTPARSASR